MTLSITTLIAILSRTLPFLIAGLSGIMLNVIMKSGIMLNAEAPMSKLRRKKVL
jgi:hypothetical protein